MKKLIFLFVTILSTFLMETAFAYCSFDATVDPAVQYGIYDVQLKTWNSNVVLFTLYSVQPGETKYSALAKCPDSQTALKVSFKDQNSGYVYESNEMAYFKNDNQIAWGKLKLSGFNIKAILEICDSGNCLKKK